jgi:AcrR family transcriptional regulator
MIMIETDKKEQILKTAQKLFAQFGLKKVTTDDIARESHISKATIYKHYKNKAEIFDEVVRRESDGLISEVRIAVDREKTVKSKFRAHLITRMKRIGSFVNFYRVIQNTWGDYWPQIARVRKQFLTEEKKIVRDILAFGNSNGKLKAKKIDITSYIMVVALSSLEFSWAVEENEISMTDTIEMMIDIILNGIKKG